MSPLLKTVTISIGNSDDKLTQKRWADYCYQVKTMVTDVANQIHFVGGTPTFSSFQSMAIIFLADDDAISLLKHSLTRIKNEFNQRSIAWVQGQTEMLE